jgi:hypothetical protein
VAASNFEISLLSFLFCVIFSRVPDGRANFFSDLAENSAFLPSASGAAQDTPEKNLITIQRSRARPVKIRRNV